jgi:drug/metabolite transporter, DME family
MTFRIEYRDAVCSPGAGRAALDATHRRTSLARGHAVALALAIAGVGLIVGFRPDARQQAVNLAGVALALGSALGYALVIVSGRAVAGRYHPLQINAIAFAAGALTLLPMAALTGLAISYPPVGWALLLYLGLVPSALAYGLFVNGMRSTPASVRAC